MKIGVIMGGISSEYEVSLNTGKEIMNNLDSDKNSICPIKIKSKKELIDKVQNLDFVILALHGKFGEDGTIQGFLDVMGIPYTGSGLVSSAICMNKDISKRLLRYEGIQTPDWLIVRNIDELKYQKIEQLGYPVIIKPNSGGSSIGTYIAHSQEEIFAAVREVLSLDNEALIEKYVKGEEITCSILNGNLLPVLSIKPKAEFFSYLSKYDKEGAEENAAQLTENQYRQIEQIATKCYEVLKCSVYARVDIIIKAGIPYVLEVNTLPGMTKNSLFPKCAKAAGISFDQLLELLIKYSLDK
ncbi:D-alanine--D-alanine ligase [Ruminiclostridium cellobioparum]|uniref:D-alanine--D-alanine ligase n=1 Tax=Ruminiclostridium cellobioparum TaxID=29355 RepID=UPI0028B14AE9|nr:D-alanine--D-alanine ligase [Ruminiclostridium cellobioparum]